MHIAICDDNKSNIKLCREYLATIQDKHNIPMTIDEFQSGKELLSEVFDENAVIDLIFLDICMPEMDGREVARELRARFVESEIIFFTVLKDSWDSAFEYKAANYLIKDQLTLEKFEKAFLLVYQEIQDKKEQMVVFSCAGESRNIGVSKIGYFESRRNIVTVHYGKENTFDFYSPIGKIQESLEHKGFVRCHRSYLVSLRHIEGIESSDIIMDNGDRIPISRNNKKTVQEAFYARDWEE